MYLMIFAIFFMHVSGFTFQERPPITQEQCSVKRKESPNQIEGNLIFFHQIKFLLMSIPDLRDDEKVITQIIDLKQKVGDQSEIISKGLFDQFKEFSSLRQVIQLEENKAPDDPQVIECYNNVLILHQKIQKLKDVINNCGSFYRKSFLDYAKETLVEIQSINTKMSQVKNYKQEDVQKEINQLERDYQLCNGHSYSPINQLQTKTKLPKKQKNQQKSKNRKNQSKKISFLQTNWEFEQYEPINYFECKNQLDELKEDFLFFLKIQQIYQHINSKLVQPIDNFYKFKDQFLKHNKAIFQAIMNINFKEIAYEKLPNNQHIQNEEQKNINDIHNTYLKYKWNRDNIQNRLKYVQELSKLLDEAYYQEINNLNSKIDQFISKNFHYQQEDVYNELKQINRDYNICFKENPYEKLIIKYHKRFVSETNEQILENLPPELKYQCDELDQIKENILTTYKNLVLIKYHEQEGRYYSHDHSKITQLFYLVKHLKLTERIIEFQNFLPNYKPDDVQAIKAYQRFQIINDVLVNLKKNYYNAYYFLEYIDEDYKKIKGYKEQIHAILGLNYILLDESIMMKNLQKYQKEYTQCTGQQFDKVYQIQTEREISQIKKTQVALIDQSRPQMLDRNKQKSSFIQYNWTYKDYPKIKESECKNEINEIREDILEFEKIQFLIKYKKSHQKEYNQLISDILAIELDFVETVKLIDLRQEEAFQFVKYPRNKDERYQVNFCYNVLEKLDRKINFVNKQAKLAEDFFKFNRVQFSTLRYNNKLLNEYLDNELNYKENDVEKELSQLYRDYEVCRKVPYNKDSEDQKKIVPHILLQQRAQKKQMKNKKVRLRSNKKNKK